VRPSIAWRVAATSSRGTENESSALPCTTFWMMVSTFTCAAAIESNTVAAEPGRSGSPVSVKMTSVSECVTPEMMGCSKTSSSGTTHVPSSSEKVEREWTRTPWLRASSTERSMSTLAPDADISSISSYEMRSSLRAPGTMRGSAV